MRSNAVLTLKIPNRFVIKPITFLILAPISIISVLFTQPVGPIQVDSLQLLTISTLSYGIFCLFLVIYKVTYLNPRIEAKSPVFGIAALAFCAGFAKGAFTTLCLAQLSESDFAGSNGFARSTSAAMIAAIGVTSLAYLNFEILRLRDIRKERIAALTESESRRMSSDAAMMTLISAPRKDIEEALRSNLTEVIDSLEDPSIAGPQLNQALSQLVDASSNQLKSLTNQLQQKLETEFPRLTWIGLFKTILTLRSFPVVPLALLSTLVTAGFVFQQNANDNPLLRIAIIAACSFLTFTLGNFWMARIEKFSITAWISTVLICAISPFAIGALFLGDSFTETANNLFAYIVFLFAFSFIACLIAGFAFQRRRIEIDLLESLDLSRVREHATSEINRRLLKEMIDFIHGRVQSRLMAAAMAISSAKNIDNQELLDAELQALRDLAQAPFERFETYRSLSFDEAMENLIRTWQGLLEISIEQESLEALNDLDAFKTSSVVEEALLNAFRHGHAMKIHISAERNGSQILLVIKDDGAGPMQGTSSLGSALFDSIATSWSLSSGPDGIGAELKLFLS